MKLFVSYASAERNYVIDLIDSLRRSHVNVWFDQNLQPSEEWWQQICTQIQECTQFMIVVTLESIYSPYCQAELQYALDLGKPVLPLLIRPLPKDVIPIFLRTKHKIDVYGLKRVSVVDIIKNFLTTSTSNMSIKAVPKRPKFPSQVIKSNVVIEAMYKLLHQPIVALMIKLFAERSIDASSHLTYEELLELFFGDRTWRSSKRGELERIANRIIDDSASIFQQSPMSPSQFIHQISIFAEISAILEYFFDDGVIVPLETPKENLDKVLRELIQGLPVRSDLTSNEQWGLNLVLERILYRVMRLTFESNIEDENFERLALKQLHEIQISDPTDHTSDSYRAKYANSINLLDRMEIFGVDVETTQYPLSVAYISLSLIESQSTSKSESAINILQKSNRWLLFGDAGSGKTTLLKWIAINAINGRFAASLSSWNSKIPFLITLRKYKNGNWPSPHEWVTMSNFSFPRDWVEKHLQKGDAIVLIDGIDELNIEFRNSFYDWVEALVNDFKDNIFIITSRTLSDENQWKKLWNVGYKTAEIQDMQISDIIQFIDKWHDAVWIQTLDEEKSELTLLHIELKDAIQANPRDFRLAKNPLLCAAICAINRDRKKFGRLPRKRIKLYQTICEMLLSKRDAYRNIDPYPDVTEHLDESRLLALFQEIAHFALENNYIDIDDADVKRIIADKLQHWNILEKPLYIDRVFKFLLERCALINKPTENKVGFVHKTLLEYLSASEAAHKNRRGLIRSKIDNEKWRMVVMFYIGLGNLEQKKEMISILLEINDLRSILLAISSLEMAEDDIEIELRKKIVEYSNALIPPPNLSAARELASAKDLVVPLLAAKINSLKNDGERDRCLLTLALIGSTDALQVLDNFGRKTDGSLLIKYWDYFDREEYADQILNKFDELEIDTLNGIEYLTNVSSLVIKTTKTPFTSLSKLSELYKLRRLDIEDGSQLTDLRPLMNLNFIEHITIHGAIHIDTILPLTALKNLSELFLYGAPLFLSRYTVPSELFPQLKAHNLDTMWVYIDGAE